MKFIARYAGSLARQLGRRENRLSSSQESLRLLAENCGDVIFRFGMDGQARYISPSVERLFGCSLKEIYAMGGSVSENGFVHEEDRQKVAQAVRKHFSGSLPELKLEFRINRKDGATVWVETNCTTILDRQSGEPSDIIFNMRDISEKKAFEGRLEALARTDGLTGVANRRAFDEALDLEWRRALREVGSLSLLVIDVDHFKAFNDANGHQAGDDCLRTVAGTIALHAKRAGDLAARYGGEEFAIILPQTEYTEALAAGARVRSAIKALGIAHPLKGVLTVSVGVATAMATSGGTIAMPQGLLQAADLALYKAKAGGRNRVEGSLLFSPTDTVRTAA